MNLICRLVTNVRHNMVASLKYSSFCSQLSLKHLYPGSNINPITPEFHKKNDSAFSGFIPRDQLQITYSRSGGPGGQNVNMVNTKIEIRFHVQTADWLNEELKKKILLQHRTKITKDGFLVVRSEKTRSQLLNVADALEKIRSMLWKLSESDPVISPETEQKLLRRKEKAERIRLAEKRTKSRVKQDRQSPAVII